MNNVLKLKFGGELENKDNNVTKNELKLALPDTGAKNAESELFFENGIESKWLTTKSAAQYLQISETALRILVYREQIKAFKFGRRLRFQKCDLDILFKRKE